MNYQEKRKQILNQMAQIKCMAKGVLTAEYRETKKKDGEKVQLGPYYKHQSWENGQNVTRRVPVADAEQLKEAVDGYHCFRKLADEFVEVTVEMTQQSKKVETKKKRTDSRL
jgi:hypothetical protein